ncbi:hypothetical protein A3B02_02680 [Candidatus Roizmanbacteria bacterium RIFCSPLOWO2_01_FULL_42_14]|uniref:Glycosyltransferase RgtA/B/C/D-like domain-containing protein n=3 Tax=Candidatus Roizmaniibacteriota TaxID=1752723 RepID=A0A1F7J799_9BACT|nr:MAG: hypothetical protein A3D08_00965 [Candidatus Roizmanbacteria bacterium RIFCSPHIGHO2_02_FULL_43_11]OGK38166.1 MAG: hypothetical protein A3F32_01515 [Candidatus Roizmanbacteria bacterium RIFCSPHIGHO2_12_FULL_42_10]OGK51479.1 MAG: hypothetical protein A3B02_02680 [Candidatus Roizmanbacteria bacterium RIFCSPLOWO2_01_FULL_42_14]
MQKYFGVILILLLILYTRFIGLNWGLPYPMHPDERNMAEAITQLKCPSSPTSFMSVRECMNPHFYAYGQAPLYTGYALVQGLHYFAGTLGASISFEEATMSLRVQSALLSMVLVGMMWKTFMLLYPGKPRPVFSAVLMLILTLQPYAIQFAHFGTTETALMLLYMSIIYACLRLIRSLDGKWILLIGAATGVAVGIKTSSLLFTALPVFVLINTVLRQSKKHIRQYAQSVLLLILSAVLFMLITSPHSIINFSDFLQSMKYEIPVGQGALKVFYTRQFEGTIPIIFQFTHIFPYTHGLPVLLLFIAGFLWLPWKDKQLNILRLSWLIFFIPTAFLYTKWTRFIAPIMPVMTVFATLIFTQIWEKISSLPLRIALLTVVILPGVAYLSIYQHPDVRFEASRVITNTIPSGSHILEEAGNVINIPIPIPDSLQPLPYYNFEAFDLYNLDSAIKMRALDSSLQEANAVIIPSRRIFADHTCIDPDGSTSISQLLPFQNCGKLLKDYPYINQYYQRLIGPESSYIQTALITSYPRIELFGIKLVEFPDERAEETWTVFDHPVVRIYEKVQ